MNENGNREEERGGGGESRHGPGSKRIVLAFAIAAVSDLLLVWLEMVPVVQWGVDGVTVVLLFLVLGRRWALLPGLVAEAVPGLALFPFWILVVASVALWGKVKPAEKPAGSSKG